MDANTKKTLQERVKTTLRNLQANNMDAAYLPTKKDVVPMLRTLMEPGSSAAVGGSVTLQECGVLDLLRDGTYRFFDRYAAKDDKEILATYRAAFSADYFLASANAVTLGGELYLVDGRGTRTAPVIFGPDHVILVVSTDKIVPDVPSAVLRTKMLAAPPNAVRLERATHCASHGTCMHLACDGVHGPALAAGACKGTICCDYVLLSNQSVPHRITVLLVGESLGY